MRVLCTGATGFLGRAVMLELRAQHHEAVGLSQRAGESTVHLWGDGTPTREFLYVDDCARAVVQAMTMYGDPRPLNLGSGEEVTIARLAEMVAQAVGWRGECLWDASKPNGQPRRFVDSSRARARLEWSPQVMLEEGLRRTVDWYMAQQAVVP